MEAIATNNIESIKVKSLVVNPAKKSHDRMLRIIAYALAMPMSGYANRTRETKFQELRKVAAVLSRWYFPDVTLKDLGRLFGGMDHTSVISAISKAYDLLSVSDESFTRKFNKAHNEVLFYLNQ